MTSEIFDAIERVQNAAHLAVYGRNVLWSAGGTEPAVEIPVLRIEPARLDLDANYSVDWTQLSVFGATAPAAGDTLTEGAATSTLFQTRSDNGIGVFLIATK